MDSYREVTHEPLTCVTCTNGSIMEVADPARLCEDPLTLITGRYAVAENGHGMQAAGAHGQTAGEGRRNVWGTVLAILFLIAVAVGAGFFLSQRAGVTPTDDDKASTRSAAWVAGTPVTTR